MEVITLAHGSGGSLQNHLIDNIFLKYFDNEYLNCMGDAAVLPSIKQEILISTDSFVVNPLFFPGGDIGKLAVCGTINDLAVSGAVPLYLTVGFIIEEGFPQEILKRIVRSMADTARKVGVSIAAGDTKVIESRKIYIRNGKNMNSKKSIFDNKEPDIYINTTGLGYRNEKSNQSIKNINQGDHIIISGYIADHGIAVFLEREEMGFNSNIQSDCIYLNNLTLELLENCPGIKFMRDPTRGGLASVLVEISKQSGKSILIHEDKIPVRSEITAITELLGFDPLYIANEGKVVVIVDPAESSDVISIMRKFPFAQDAAIIGEVQDDNKDFINVLLKTKIGGTRILTALNGELIPRIC